MEKVKPAAFLLIKTNLNAYHVVRSIRNEKHVQWASAVYGPYQIVAYIESENQRELAEFIESIRTQRRILELDARMCKVIPGDQELKPFKITKPEFAVLLINVNYKEEKERIVTINLRRLKGVLLSRAMWGPADIVVVVEEQNHELMRNLICDKIKTLKGVLTNTTLYCYSEN
jgi:nitrate reductase NapAB chaperone NapD